MFLKNLKNNSLRARFTFYFTLTLGVLVLFSTVALFAYLCHEIWDEEEEELEILIAKIHKEFTTNKALSKASLEVLNDKMSFLFDSNSMNLGYRFYDKKDNIIAEHYLTKENPFKGLEYKNYLGKTGILFSSHEVWTFIHAKQFDNMTIMVSSFHEEEFIERFLVGFASIFPVVIIISIFAGSRLSKMIVNPLDKIALAAHKIESGDLSARIPELDEDDEIAKLISTLNNTFNELENSFSQINQFSSDVAHELKTPLTAIRGNLEVSLGAASSKEELQAASAMAIDEIMTLNKIIDSLLIMAKPGSTYKNNDFQEFDLSQCVLNVLQQIKVLADVKEVELNHVVEPNVSLNGVESLFHQLCFNLISNAVKFSKTNGHISVNLKSTKNTITLEVKDDGIGIDKQHLEQIFDRFFQVDTSRFQGTGLGLAMVKWIAELHGGTVLVTSKPDEGSLFITTLKK